MVFYFYPCYINTLQYSQPHSDWAATDCKAVVKACPTVHRVRVGTHNRDRHTHLNTNTHTKVVARGFCSRPNGAVFNPQSLTV